MNLFLCYLLLWYRLLNVSFFIWLLFFLLWFICLISVSCVIYGSWQIGSKWSKKVATIKPMTLWSEKMCWHLSENTLCLSIDIDYNVWWLLITYSCEMIMFNTVLVRLIITLPPMFSPLYTIFHNSSLHISYIFVW